MHTTNETPGQQPFEQERPADNPGVEPEIVAPASNEKLRSSRNAAALVYALQAASLLIGITFLAAVIVNYVKLSDVRGTWLQSHFRWQIRTFWFTFLWALLGALTLGIGIGFFVLLANSVWFVYRIVKGWLNLNDGKEMYI